ncbi:MULTISPECIES: hypothetical protein [unclassified Sphingomonas]|jgi:hypothetical protein|uniref:hypothetical protein n=1 Tax=unclassified Sphingomonas TaxID=196159 RepID=UPI000E10AB33|nr:MULTISPECIES: hypothetical protein [unclassified Sphingomonas]AXJ95416.1 hypothetical protein DM480_07680 [Sphingomonas sp. FARSPH]
MVDFTQEERLRIAQALADDMGGENTKAVDAAALGADPKQLFCQNWPLVKTVLGYIKPLLPAPIGWVISGLIAAGDILHGKIC